MVVVVVVVVVLLVVVVACGGIVVFVQGRAFGSVVGCIAGRLKW